MKSLDLSIILKLVDKVTAPLKGVVGGFGKVKSSADAAIASVSRFDRVSAAVQRTTDRLGSMAAMAGKAVSALALVGGISGGAAAFDSVGITAKFEDMYATLDTLYQGNDAKIRESQAWIRDFTAKTPYEMDGVTEAFTRLKAYGIDPMDGTLKTLGDTSAAMGKDVMAAVEMMSDAIMGENERLKEFGVKGSAIQGTDYIQYDYIDKTGNQQKRQVLKTDKQQIQRVLTEILKDNFNGAMKKRSETFNGIMSNVKDVMSGLQMQFMQAGPFEIMKKGLQGRLDMLNDLAKSGKVEEWGRKTAEFMKLASATADNLKGKVVEAATKMADFVGGWQNLGKIGAGAAGLWVFRDLIFAITAGMGGLPLLLAGVTASLWKWHDLLPSISRYFPKLGEWLGERLPAASEKLQGVWKQLSSIWQEGLDKNSVEKASQALGVLVDGSIPRLEKFKKISALAFGPNVVEKFGKATDWLALRLPKLEAKVISVFGTVKQWVTGSGEAVKSALGGVAEKAIGQFTAGLEWLNAKANDGSIGRWLDLAASKIRPVLDNVLAFGDGLLKAVVWIASFVGKFAEFIGGWDKLAMVLAGGWVIAALSGFLQGLAALAGIMAFLLSPIGLLVALIAALAIGARYVYLEWDNMSTGSRVLAVAIAAVGVGILAYISYLKLAAWWTAFQLTPIGAWIAGLSLASVWAGISAAATWVMTAATTAFGVAMAIVTSPITLVIAAIAALAAGAYLLYTNWDTIKPMLLAFWEDVKAAWETFKTWVAGLIDSVAQTFWAGWEKVKTYTVELANSIITFFAELPAKMLEVGGNIINGLWDGLKNSATAVVDWMAGFGSDIIDSAKGILGINSPSRVFAEIGGFTVEGMQQGMETAQPKLFSFLDGFGDKLTGWWKGVADAFTGDDIAANIGKAFEVTKNALPSLPAPVSNALAAVLPGGGIMSAVGTAIKAAQKAPHINPASADAAVISGMPTVGRISSEYGMRTHPITGKQKMHAGIDIAAAAGTAVNSTGIGTVAFMGQMPGYGNTLIVQHDKGIQTVYAHLKDFEGGMSVGSAVQKGQRLGGVGNTGASTGNHLHYEVRQAAQVATQATAQLGAAVKNLGSGDQAERIKNAVATFESLGWTHKQAVGIVANLKQESELMAHPKPGDSGTAHGVAQWRGSRLEDFRAAMGKDISQSNLDEQLRFVHHELTQGKERGAGKRLKASETAQQAAAVVSQYYERPFAKEWEKTHRAGIAGSIEQKLAGNRAQGGNVDAGNLYRVNELGPELLTMGGMTYLMAHQPGYVTPITNQMPPAIQDLQARAANDPLFAQALNKQSDGNTGAGDNSTVVPFARPAPAQPVIAPQQTISITINAAPGMTAQDIAAEVQRMLREENRRAEAKYRGRAYD